METTRKENNNILLLVLLVAVLAGVIGYLVWPKQVVAPGHNTPIEPGQAACTLEAKQCPDGSYVGRSGPNCEFAACPEVKSEVKSIEGWKTMIDQKNGVTFQYPASLGTKYIHTVDWPPKATLMPGPFACLETDPKNTSAGKTEARIINGQNYCITVQNEGAAGSTYSEYAYAVQKDDKVVILNFTLRSVQCGNYDGSEMKACEAERAAFSIDTIVDKIVSTLKLEAK